MLKLKEKVIVANTGDDTLTFINFDGERRASTLNLKDLVEFSEEKAVKFQGPHIGPYDLEYDGKEYIYCTNVYDNSVLKIELRSREVVDIITVGKYPTCIKYFDKYLYITNSDSNSVSVVDVEDFSIVENISVGEKPIDIEIDKKSKKLYIANCNGHSIDVIDIVGDDRKVIRLVDNPVKMIIDNDQMYILSNANNGTYNNGNVSIMNLETYKIKNSCNIEGIFNNMVKVNGREIIFITNMDNGYLYRMDIKRGNLLSKTYLSGMPNKLEWNGENILFVSNISTNMLTVFDTKLNRVIGNIKVGLEPNEVLTLN